MKAFFKKWFGWLAGSNRPSHLIVGSIIGSIFGFIPVLIAALAVEFKDWAWNGSKGHIILGWKTKNGFDWLDVAATLIGGAIGSSIVYFCAINYAFSFLTGFF